MRLTYWLIFGSSVATVLVAVLGVSQDRWTTSTPKPGSGPSISDTSRMQLLTTYNRVLNYSQNQQKRMLELCDRDPQCIKSRDDAQKAAQEWNKLVPEIVAKEKLPVGTGFNVDAGTGTVNVVVPPKGKP